MLDTLKNKTCLVTGASGFIGTYLCKELTKQGAIVKGMFRSECNGEWNSYVLCKLGEQSIPAEFLNGVDIIFHLAGYAHSLVEDPAEGDQYFKTNVKGTRDLLLAAESAKIQRFVYISSVKSMGEVTKQRLNETSQQSPTSPYGKSKLEAEKLVLQSEFIDFPTVLRLPMVYGESEKGNLPRMVNAISKNRFPPIPQIENKRSMIHVNDVVQGAILAATSENSARKIYILTDSIDYSTRQLYELICKSLGKNNPSWAVPVFVFYLLAKVGDLLNYLKGARLYFGSSNYQKLFGDAYYSCGKANADLGFQSKYTLYNSINSIASAIQKK